jgi:hypothetical protein
MIRNEEHPFPAPGNMVPSPHTRKIEGKSEKQKSDQTGENHGQVRSPDPQTREYSCRQHDVYFLPASHLQMLVTGHLQTP